MDELYIYYKVAQARLLKERRENLQDLWHTFNGSALRCNQEIKEITEKIEGLVGCHKKKSKRRKIASEGLKLRLKFLGRNRKKTNGTDT